MATEDATADLGSASIGLLDGVSVALPGAFDVEDLARLLERGGARVLRFQHGATSSQPGIEQWLRELCEGRFDDVVFFTAHGVRLVCELSRQLDRQPAVLDALRGTRIIAQGPRTARALSEFGLRASARSTSDDTDALLEVMSRVHVHGRTVALQPWDSGENAEVLKWLERAGAEVFLAKQSPGVTDAASELIAALRSSATNAVVFPDGADVAWLWDRALATNSAAELAAALETVLVIASEGAARALVERGVPFDGAPVKTLRERWPSGRSGAYVYRTLVELDAIIEVPRLSVANASAAE